MYVCMYNMYMHMSMYIYIYLYIYLYIFMFMCIHTCIYTYISPISSICIDSVCILTLSSVCILPPLHALASPLTSTCPHVHLMFASKHAYISSHIFVSFYRRMFLWTQMHLCPHFNLFLFQLSYACYV